MNEHNGPNILSGLPLKTRHLIANIVTGFLVLMLLFLIYGGYRSITSRYAGVSETEYLMGTMFEVKVNGENTSQHVRAVFNKIRDIAKTINYYDEKSELSQINNMAGISAVAVSKDTFDIIDKALQFSRRSGGAFDLTIGPLIDIWNFGKDDRQVPSGNALVYAQHLVNYGNVILSSQNETVKILYPGMKIDLGGVGKGYAISKARGILVDRGVKSAIISAGSTVAVIGENHGKPWRIGIRDPFNTMRTIGAINLKAGMAVSTSGDYERYFDKDGKRYHHILDPSTGMPADETKSVTIVCDDANLADMMSTAVFVMGPKKGMQFVSTFPNTYAVIVNSSGEVFVTSGITLEKE